VLSWDLSMGLSLHFQSTLYSWWFFMGAWLCALTMFALLVMAWDARLGTADGLIQQVHYHDIGKLCFAFTAFWGYLTFGQYLVIWYGNMGEETFFRVFAIPPWQGDGDVGGPRLLRRSSVALARGEGLLPTLALFAGASLLRRG
jgi:hypothetical protein